MILLQMGTGKQFRALVLVFTFPVTVQQGPNGPIATRTPLNWKLLTQLRSAVSAHGLHSKPVRQMLNYIWGLCLLCAEDITTLCRLIMTPSQTMSLDQNWHAQAVRVARVPHQQGDPLRGVTVDQLCGTGHFFGVNAQLRFPIALHGTAMDISCMAISAVPSEPRTPPYVSIKQGMNESYASLVDRLVAALNGAPDMTEEMKLHLLRTSAFENANGKTQSILVNLPRNSSVEERVSLLPTTDSQAYV